MTPDKKKIVYPLTPDYQIRKKKNNNNIINYQYTPILEAHPKKIINYQYNNYTPIKSNNPQNVIKYQPPKKVVKANGKNYYLMPPTTLPGKKIKRGSLHPMTRITEEFEDLFVFHVSYDYTKFINVLSKNESLININHGD